MNDDDHSLQLLNRVLQELSYMKSLQHLQVKAQREILLDQVREAFERDKNLPTVLRFIDCDKSQTEIVEAMEREGASGAKRSIVSRSIKKLSEDLGLIECLPTPGKGKIYCHSVTSRILGLPKSLIHDDASKKG